MLDMHKMVELFGTFACKNDPYRKKKNALAEPQRERRKSRKGEEVSFLFIYRFFFTSSKQSLKVFLHPTPKMSKYP